MTQAAGKQRYHHGDLRSALLGIARRVVETDGMAGLTLRGITRRAGVSPMAAAAHFGSISGLLSELAAIGFEELQAAMAAVPAAHPRETGYAYVLFAIRNPGLFTLMFRSDVLDGRHNPRLDEASTAAFASLRQTAEVGAVEGRALSATARLAARWGLVHGLAVLAIDGRLARLLDRGAGASAIEQLVAAALHLPPDASDAA